MPSPDNTPSTPAVPSAVPMSDARAAHVPDRAQSAQPGLWLLLAAYTVIFLAFTFAVARGGRVPLDASLLTWLHQHTSAPLTAVARALTYVGDPTLIAPLTLLLAVALLLRRHWRQAAVVAVKVAGAAVVDLVLKELLARPRPTLFAQVIPESGYSFPSGHAVGDLAFFLAVAALLRETLPARWHWLGIVGIVLALLCGASRPYLQLHYPSDVVAGWALGAAWVLLVSLVADPILRRMLPEARLAQR